MKPREPRQKVVLPARMRAGAGQIDICIRDLSSRGMLVQATAPPVRGTYVEIMRPACTIIGQVIWCKDRRFGIQTRERILLDAVLERRTVPRSNDTGPGAPLAQRAHKRPSAASLAHRAELNRQLAAKFQHAFLALGAAAGAFGAAALLYRSLADMVGAVTGGLS